MLLILALLTLLVQVVAFVRMLAGARTIRPLRAEPLPGPGEPLPTVSLVLAARDEARAIEPAALSMLAQRYPALELVAVDDRSTDGTGAILDRVAAADPRLRVVHVRELPPGWLGKNHALWLGAQATTGEWLLFTDGDVLMEPEALTRAVAFAERRRLDFLAVPPGVVIPTAPLELFMSFLFLALFGWIQPGKARDPHSSAHIGTGAFNLLRRSTYEALGTHRRIPLRPDDDLTLGKAAKLAGAREDLASGEGVMTVTWYGNLREAWVGLRKNALAGLACCPPSGRRSPGRCSAAASNGAGRSTRSKSSSATRSRTRTAPARPDGAAAPARAPPVRRTPTNGPGRCRRAPAAVTRDGRLLRSTARDRGSSRTTARVPDPGR